jgi:hypothetical protein
VFHLLYSKSKAPAPMAAAARRALVPAGAELPSSRESACGEGGRATESFERDWKLIAWV